MTRGMRVLRMHRRVVCHEHAAIETVDGPDPYAVAIPGRGGRIVISTAMFDLLDTEERAVVVAHEQAHARFRHDRYLLVARTVGALLPGTGHLCNRLHFIIERWADESAATRHGDKPRRPRPPRVVIGGLWLAIIATAALATMQAHHLAALITALCPGG